MSLPSRRLRGAEQFLAVAQKLEESIPIPIGHRLKGASLTMLGEFEPARAELDRAIAGYVPEMHRPLAARFGQDICVAALVYRSWASWALGEPQAALWDADEAIKGAREIGQAGTLMHALFHVAIPQILSGNIPIALRYVDELGSIAADKGGVFWSAPARLLQGWIMTMNGDHSDAAGVIAEALDQWSLTGARFCNPLWYALLAHTHQSCGHFQQARTCLAAALSSIGASNERWAEAEVYRLAGEMARMSINPDLDEAEAHFRRSIAVARKQRASSWELRAATSLARLLRERGRSGEARDLIVPVYQQFAGGLETPDQQKAKTLVAELARQIQLEQ